jgi:hypothetical protein
MDHLHQRLLERTHGTPYTVSVIDGGLRLHLDVADATWRRTFHQRRLRKEYSVNLRMNPAKRTYSREQVVRQMRWIERAGAEPEVEFTGGTGGGSSAPKEFGFMPQRREPGFKDYHFDARELVDLVDEVMRADGWTRTMDRSSRIGLVLAAVGLVAALGGVAVALFTAFS